MNEQSNHEMVLESTDSSGAEEWYCPTCGRRFVLSWPPNYQRTILNAGDELAGHSGGKGGLKMDSIQVGNKKSSGPELPGRVIAALEKILKDFNPDEPADR